MSNGNANGGGRLTVVPPPPPVDHEAQTVAAWREVAAGYRRALELLPIDHPDRPRFMAIARDAAFLGHVSLVAETSS